YAAWRDRPAARAVRRRKPPLVRAVPNPLVRIVDRVLALRDGRAPRVLEVVDPLPPHVRIADAAEIDPHVRVLVPEQRREVHVLLAVEVAPLVILRPLVPRRRLDGVGRRA